MKQNHQTAQLDTFFSPVSLCLSPSLSVCISKKVISLYPQSVALGNFTWREKFL